jgi:hypothetical protein
MRAVTPLKKRKGEESCMIFKCVPVMNDTRL